jgi:hypothetical protein
MTDMGSLVAEFLADAEAGGTYSRDQLRALRRELAHVVVSDVGVRDPATVTADDVRALPGALVDPLRLVFAYAVERGLIGSSPLVGLAPAADPAPTPTTAILALGARVATWTVRAVVAGFVLVAIGLVVALA